MTFSPLFPFALGGFYTPHASGTFRAVFGTVGAGGEQRPADGAPFGVLAVEQGVTVKYSCKVLFSSCKGHILKVPAERG